MIRMSSVVEKIFIMRQIRLPYDINEEIIGFNFYDKETTISRSITRSKKQHLLNMIKRPIMKGYDETGCWCFWAGEEEPQFQSSNCFKCGNYVYVFGNNKYMKCFCK